MVPDTRVSQITHGSSVCYESRVFLSLLMCVVNKGYLHAHEKNQDLSDEHKKTLRRRELRDRKLETVVNKGLVLDGQDVYSMTKTEQEKLMKVESQDRVLLAAFHKDLGGATTVGVLGAPESWVFRPLAFNAAARPSGDRALHASTVDAPRRPLL